MSKTGFGLQLSNGCEHSQARKMCMDSAIDIAKLLHIYESQHTLRRMNIQGVAITCSAALLLIFGKTSRDYTTHEESELATHLSTCFRALDEFSPCWESAKRVREFLIRLQREWEARAKAQSSRMRSSYLVSNPEESMSISDRSRKRTRTLGTSNTWAEEGFHEVSNLQLQQGQGSHQGLNGERNTDMGWIVAWNSQPTRGVWDNWANIVPNEFMR